MEFAKTWQAGFGAVGWVAKPSHPKPPMLGFAKAPTQPTVLAAGLLFKGTVSGIAFELRFQSANVSVWEIPAENSMR